MLKPSKAFLLDLDVHIRVAKGVPQGSPLSCILFVIAIEPLLISLRDNFKGIVLEAYADDLAIISKKASLLPAIQDHITKQAALVGLKVHECKSCLLPPEQRASVAPLQSWNRPEVTADRKKSVSKG